jgi:hypothetical protein
MNNIRFLSFKCYRKKCQNIIRILNNGTPQSKAKRVIKKGWNVAITSYSKLLLTCPECKKKGHGQFTWDK